jgi:hypothetical protein
MFGELDDPGQILPVFQRLVAALPLKRKQPLPGHLSGLGQLRLRPCEEFWFL